MYGVTSLTLEFVHTITVSGIVMEGVGAFVFGLFALPVGVTTYSENVGTLGITRVCSFIK